MKFGICSEIFKEWNDIERTIAYVKETGYDGIEIAPFTLAQYVTDIPNEIRRKIVQKAEEAELDIIGIHWVLVGPDGLYLTHPDREIRKRTAQYLKDLAQFAGDIGGKVMIFGSPKQRNLMEGVSREQAMDYATEVFQEAMPACESNGVTICMEPLSTQETNFCYTAAETLELVKKVDHPCFQMMLDCKAMTTEEKSRPELIREFHPWMRHFHANDPNLNGPGWGDLDFAPIFDALKEVKYPHYVSVEVFNFEPGPEAIASKSLEYMKKFV